MSEHLLADEIKSYLKREMSPAELLRADDHLAICDVCYKKVNELEVTAAATDLNFLRDSPEAPEHLRFEQLENYVDGKADGVAREIADVHLKTCGGCRAELNGLIELRTLIEADLQKASPPEKSIPARKLDFFAGWRLLKPGFAVAALLIFFTAVFFITKRDSAPPEIAEKTPPANLNLPPGSKETPAINTEVNAAINARPNNNVNLQNQSPAANKPDEFPPGYQSEIEQVLASNRLNLPAELGELAGQNGKLMGGATDAVPFALENPLGKIIQSDRPQFRWRVLVGADGYIVNVYDTNFNRVAGSPQITATNWQTDRPLGRDKTYIWQVTALKDGQEIKSPTRPAPDAKFKILDASNTNELARLSRQYKNEHLSLGILYAKAGLLDEAVREFQKELAKNPSSTAARKFLQDIRRLR